MSGSMEISAKGDYATRKVRQTHEEYDMDDHSMVTRIVHDEVNPYHKAWIGAIMPCRSFGAIIIALGPLCTTALRIGVCKV